MNIVTTRAHLDKQIAELAGRGVTIEEDAEKKTVTFKMDLQLLMTLPDKQLYRLMQAARRVELMFEEMGYKSIDQHGKTITGEQVTR